MRNSIGELKNRFEMAKEIISEPEDKTTEINQSQKQTQKRMQKNVPSPRSL